MSVVSRVTTQTKLRLERARARWGWFDVVLTTFKRFSEDDIGTHAAALTYYIFFSIFPLLLFATSILGFLALDPETQSEIFDKATRAVPLLKDALNPNGFATIQANRQELAVTGVALALYSGSGAVVALEHALNKMFGVVREPNFVKKRLKSLMWLGILGAGALASVAATSATEVAKRAVGGPGASAFSFLGYIVGVAVSVAVFAAAFKVLPGRKLAWREVLPGAVIAALAFEILKIAGSAYMATGKESRNATFGAFAAAAGLLAASYLISQITLLSAEVNKVLAERRLTRQSQLDRE